MSGLDLALARRAKSSSAAALRDSASEEREGRVTRRDGGSMSTASCGMTQKDFSRKEGFFQTCEVEEWLGMVGRGGVRWVSLGS